MHNIPTEAINRLEIRNKELEKEIEDNRRTIEKLKTGALGLEAQELWNLYVLSFLK